MNQQLSQPPGDDASAPWNSPEARDKLFERTKNILLKPSAEWERIDQEPASISGIYRKHVFALAAVPVLAGLIGSLVFGYSALGITYRPPLVPTLVSALLQYGLTLAGVFVLALVINALAPRFEATRNKVQAFKVAAYSATAAWVAGIFEVLPALSMLSILGLYSLYLLYLGLPRLMRAPQKRALGYCVVVVIVMLVLGLVIGGLTSMITRQSLVRTSPGAGGLADILGSARETGSSGSINIPGVGAVQIDRLEEMARPLEELGRALQDPSAAAMQPVEPQVLAALLPERVLGLEATEHSSATTGMGGLGGSHARVWYGSDDNTVSLEIVDMSGALGALAGLMSMEVDRRTASGYERVGRVNGRMTSEEWDSRTGRGTYGVLVADRVMVRARGHGVDIAQLKDVVHGIDFQSLEKAVAAN